MQGPQNTDESARCPLRCRMTKGGPYWCFALAGQRRAGQRTASERCACPFFDFEPLEGVCVIVATRSLVIEA
eukprot:CAMPEP_0206457440 /NCGR_PEP_ID=MMETSP0324_2-20121206/22960_1 /ASSEMBLY_ACC=CAM_ASM_000836 /TAXON_ID=2866 /ORGANISM="Crypthecodinium cohnii, Strain Seligo" /LENGTH=71 /DNA_ID=CAMNT_0053928557 /DNA_START=70 /DNA_END=285 /DNA_ORIENTATION=+